MTLMEGIAEKPAITDIFSNIIVYDIFGRKVTEGKYANITDALPSGTYLIRSTDDLSHTKKISVVH